MQADTVYQRNGNNLEVLIRGSTDKLVVTNWYLGMQYQVEQFDYADGSTLGNAQVASLISAMAVFDESAPATRTTPLVAVASYWRGADLGLPIM